MRLVIVPCSSRKKTYSQADALPAAELFTGPYFRSTLATALKMVPRAQVRILSTRYGLIGLDDRIKSYNQRLGRPGTVEPATVLEQATAAGLLGAEVVALCGSGHAAIIRSVWPAAECPLLEHKGLGHQMSALKRMRES